MRSSIVALTTSMAATGLRPAPNGTAYAVWLCNSPGQVLFVRFPKSTATDAGKLDVVADLTPQTPTYASVLLTRETSEKPRKPGPIVLRSASRA